MERAHKVPRSEWSALPEVLLHKILAELPSKTRQAARLVCTSWRDNLGLQSVKSNQLDDKELHAVCCKHPAIKRLDITNSLWLTNRGLLPLSKLTGLTYLSLSGSEGIRDGGKNSLAGLEALTRLRELHVSHMSSSPSAVERVGRLTGLTTLNMSGEGGGISLLDGHLTLQLTNLTNLRCLSLRGIKAKIGDDSVLTNDAEDLLKQMLEGLPLLNMVTLLDIQFSGTALQAFQRHRLLQSLRIFDCPILLDLTGLDGLPSLSSLDVYPINLVVGPSSLTCLPALRRLMIGGNIDSRSRSLTEPFGSLSTLHELVLMPNAVMMSEHRCDDLLQLSQLKVLEISAEHFANSRYTREYNWHPVDRLFSHPGLTRLSWTSMEKSKYSWDGRDEEDHILVPYHQNWSLEALSRSYACGKSKGGPILCQINLQEWVMSPESSLQRFDLVFTRRAACQA